MPLLYIVQWRWQFYFVPLSNNRMGATCGAGTVHLISPPIYSRIRVAQSFFFLCSVLYIIVCPFVMFIFAVGLSALLRSTAS